MTESARVLHLRQAFAAAGSFEPFIRQIRFPLYRNLNPGLSIDFEFPVTAIVGPNGANKSSILRALQGCPEEHNVGNYWFGTSLDPISGGLDRYIHGYQLPSGERAEVIKGRVQRKTRNPDYFETQRPRVRDGMAKMSSMEQTPAQDRTYRTSSRWKSIAKDVRYIDFRQEIPAYDIQFYFNWRKKSGNPSEKKELVRKRSRHVAAALDGLEAHHEFYGQDRILEPAIELSGAEVQSVSRILGREYSSIRIVKHDLFEAEGYTARLSTPHFTYSEAFAGSGEFAAIILVHTLSNAPDRSLILMDEPEVSLHPGAQRELMEFVLTQTLSHGHQVILATHSPSIIESLPAEAIKVLDISASTGHVDLFASHATPSEAFARIGATTSVRAVYVEDELAAEILRRAARCRGGDFLSSMHFAPLPGGADTIKTRYIPSLAQTVGDSTIVLDGDQRPVAAIPDPSAISQEDVATALHTFGISDRHLLRNGGDGDSSAETIQRRHETLAWVHANVKFLPGDGTPEELLAEMCGDQIPPSMNAKQFWFDKTKQALNLSDGESPTSSDILQLQRVALARIDLAHPLLAEVLGLLESIH